MAPSSHLAHFAYIAHAAAAAAVLSSVGCLHAPPAQAPVGDGNARVVADGLQKLRAATIQYKQFDAAVAAGYAREAACIMDERRGAMGYHHVNHQYIDGTLDVTKPQMLLYERLPDSSYRLNGVEFIVPYANWSRDSLAPVLMGQALHHENNLMYWYIHVWAWTNNRDGLFANMNPDVHCPGGGRIYKASVDSLSRRSIDGRSVLTKDTGSIYSFG
jgi:hypothetical protein